MALAVLTSRQDQWLQEVQTELADQPNAASRLAELAPALLRLHASDPTGWSMSVISNDLASVPTLASTAAAVTRRWIDWLTGVIEQGQAEGSILPDLDPESTAVVLFAAMDGLRQTTEIVEAPRGQRSAFARHVQTMSTIIQRGIVVEA